MQAVFGDPEGKGNGGIPVGIVIKDGKEYLMIKVPDNRS
jgi:hypothetical protein